MNAELSEARRSVVRPQRPPLRPFTRQWPPVALLVLAACLAGQVVSHAADAPAPAPVAAPAKPAPATAKPDPAAKPDATGKAAPKAGALPGVEAPNVAPQSEITADQLDYDFDKRLATFDGHVHAIKDQMDLYSDKMVVTFSADNEIANMEATKNVRIVKEDKEATSGKATYDVVKDMVVLTETPVMTQGPNRLSGSEVLIYHQKEGRFETKGGRCKLQLQKKGGQQSSALPGLVPVAGTTPTSGAPLVDTGRQVITSDLVAYNPATRKIDFTGNVEVEDGEVRMTAMRMAVSLNAQDEVEHLDAAEHVVIARDGRKATSEQAVYDLSAGTIVLTGAPELNQDGGRVLGAERIVYRRENGKLTAEGGRPRLVLDKVGKDSDFDVVPAAGTGSTKDKAP